MAPELMLGALPARTRTRRQWLDYAPAVYPAHPNTRSEELFAGANGGPRKDPELAEFTVRRMDSFRSRMQATALVARRYQARGYDVELRASYPNAQLELITVAADGEKVTGTLTMSLDGPGGLAAEQVYRDEVQYLRSSGRKLCEAVKFAAETATNPLAVLPALFHVAYIWAYCVRRCTDLLIEVTPKHAHFYSKVLGFERIGRECLNPRVNTTGVLLHLDLRAASQMIALAKGGTSTARLYGRSLSAAQQSSIVARLVAGSSVLVDIGSRTVPAVVEST